MQGNVKRGDKNKDTRWLSYVLQCLNKKSLWLEKEKDRERLRERKSYYVLFTHACGGQMIVLNFLCLDH